MAREAESVANPPLNGANGHIAGDFNGLGPLQKGAAAHAPTSMTNRHHANGRTVNSVSNGDAAPTDTTVISRQQANVRPTYDLLNRDAVHAQTATTKGHHRNGVLTNCTLADDAIATPVARVFLKFSLLQGGDSAS